MAAITNQIDSLIPLGSLPPHMIIVFVQTPDGDNHVITSRDGDCIEDPLGQGILGPEQSLWLYRMEQDGKHLWSTVLTACKL